MEWQIFILFHLTPTSNHLFLAYHDNPESYLLKLCSTLVLAGRLYHWERRTEDQADPSWVRSFYQNRWASGGLRGPDYYHHRHTGPDSECPVSITEQASLSPIPALYHHPILTPNHHVSWPGATGFQQLFFAQWNHKNAVLNHSQSEWDFGLMRFQYGFWLYLTITILLDCFWIRTRSLFPRLVST